MALINSSMCFIGPLLQLSIKDFYISYYKKPWMYFYALLTLADSFLLVDDSAVPHGVKCPKWTLDEKQTL